MLTVSKVVRVSTIAPRERAERCRSGTTTAAFPERAGERGNGRHNGTIAGRSAKADREGRNCRHKFVVTAAELHDAFPAKKIDVKDVTPVTYDDLEGNPPKAKTVEQARELADSVEDGTNGEDDEGE